VAEAFLCNAREETLGPLAIESGQVLVPLSARLTTIRLVVPEAPAGSLVHRERDRVKGS
jgi:hypothetical protein